MSASPGNFNPRTSFWRSPRTKRGKNPTKCITKEQESDDDDELSEVQCAEEPKERREREREKMTMKVRQMKKMKGANT